MQVKELNARDYKNSAEARAAGFSTLQWLRAFTFAEHAARIDRDRVEADRAMFCQENANGE